MTRFGVTTDYERNAVLKRDYLRVWSGPFYGVHEADGVSLPKGDGYMLTTCSGDKVRVVCPTPRNDENFAQIDAAISEALTKICAKTMLDSTEEASDGTSN